MSVTRALRCLTAILRPFWAGQHKYTAKYWSQTSLEVFQTRSQRSWWSFVNQSLAKVHQKLCISFLSRKSIFSEPLLIIPQFTCLLSCWIVSFRWIIRCLYPKLFVKDSMPEVGFKRCYCIQVIKYLAENVPKVASEIYFKYIFPTEKGKSNLIHHCQLVKWLHQEQDKGGTVLEI